MTFYHFLMSIPTPLWLGAAWLFSVWVGTMPPLPPNVSYRKRWAHDFLQVAAANLDRKTSYTETIQTQDSATTKSMITGPADAVPPVPKH